MWSRGLTGGERTVKRLRLSKALTVPATTTIYEACKRMASRRVDALLLTDSNEMLCGILTDKVCHYDCSKRCTKLKKIQWKKMENSSSVCAIFFWIFRT